MREILFRGKRLSDGEWVTGYYIQPTYHWHKRGIHKDWIACGAVSNGGWLNLLQKYAVIPETVGQFTGLTDKNGKKIFEGDICKVGNLIYKVVFEYSCWWFKILSNKVYCCPAFNSHCGEHCEIIGNIHDNPELLTKEE